MKLTVQLFGSAAELANRTRLVVEVCDKTVTCTRLRTVIVQYCPQIENLMPSARLAINCSYVAEDTLVSDQDEIALIQAVGGG